ncbi:MAG: hypothetical protein JWO78_1604 [Micavibrio sp.]|nr:hypothetical protein [Micavibrio sp.]
MSEIKGKNYKLAGFEISQHNTLVRVFAKFCNHDDDPQNLPEKHNGPIFQNGEPLSMQRIYPKISAQEIIDVLVGPDDISPKQQDSLGLPGNPEDILNDLGPEKLALVLVAIGKAKKEFLNRDIVINVFVPVAVTAAESKRQP